MLKNSKLSSVLKNKWLQLFNSQNYRNTEYKKPCCLWLNGCKEGNAWCSLLALLAALSPLRWCQNKGEQKLFISSSQVINQDQSWFKSPCVGVIRSEGFRSIITIIIHCNDALRTSPPSGLFKTVHSKGHTTLYLYLSPRTKNSKKVHLEMLPFPETRQHSQLN